MSGHGAVFIDPRAFSEADLQHAKSQIAKGGRLDVVVQPPPASVAEADEIAQKLYGYAPPRISDLNYTVLFDAKSHEKEWQVRFGGADSGVDNSRVSLLAGAPLQEQHFFNIYKVVAVGGTWDHVHWGHRLMLTLAAYTARDHVVLGVTGTELLAKKQYAAALQSYDMRANAAIDFIQYLRPSLRVQPAQMLNMFGPTVEIEDIDALVVSHETSSGGGLVNQEREKLHWRPLHIIEVGLVPGHGPEGTKLSSTDLRREELAERAQSHTKI